MGGKNTSAETVAGKASANIIVEKIFVKTVEVMKYANMDDLNIIAKNAEEV